MKLNKILLAIIWILTAVATIGTVAYILVDTQNACKWSLFLPAIMGSVATIWSVITKIVSKNTNKAALKVATSK